jgi:hypothetical protein
MNQSHRYRINQPAVIAEIIDSEAIIVNLDSGAYYSLRDSACTIWNLLVQGYTPIEVVTGMQAEYTGDTESMRSGVEALLAELLAEALLVPVEPMPAAVPAFDTNGDTAGVLPQFLPPLMEKFTDMADLLLLDPIHEVDTMGWPHAAPSR